MGGADVFGSLGALGGLSGDLVAFLLAILEQRGGAERSKKLSARGDDSGKRKRRDGWKVWCFFVLPVDY